VIVLDVISGVAGLLMIAYLILALVDPGRF